MGFIYDWLLMVDNRLSRTGFEKERNQKKPDSN